MSDQLQLPRIKMLHAVLDKLPNGKQAFANDLMNGYRRYGRLSPRQMEWVEKLILLATAPPQAATSEEHSQRIPGFKCVEDLLYHAAAHIQFPCIRLQTEKGQRIQLRPRKGERAVTVHVGDSRGVCRDEVLDTSYLRYLSDLTDVMNTLHEMAAHPLETAILYGKKFKSCCFCGISLTDPRSLVVGYGPICAGNYGLPWGEETLPKVTVEELEQLLEAQK